MGQWIQRPKEHIIIKGHRFYKKNINFLLVATSANDSCMKLEIKIYFCISAKSLLPTSGNLWKKQIQYVEYVLDVPTQKLRGMVTTSLQVGLVNAKAAAGADMFCLVGFQVTPARYVSFHLH